MSLRLLKELKFIDIYICYIDASNGQNRNYYLAFVLIILYNECYCTFIYQIFSLILNNQILSRFKLSGAGSVLFKSDPRQRVGSGSVSF